MPLNHSGISVWLTDCEENELPAYNINIVNENKIECWIPSTEGANFKIMWKIPNCWNRPDHDLAIYPSLDGAPMSGRIWDRAYMFPERIGVLDSRQTGPSTVRLYEFRKRILTGTSLIAAEFIKLINVFRIILHSDEDGDKPAKVQLKYLNTIMLDFVWGDKGESLPASEYKVPQEPAPLHEKLAKKGHSAAAGLGKTVTRTHLLDRRCEFHTSTHIKPTTFIFRYAPRDWLKARDIIPQSPQPSLGPHFKPKRERSFDSDVIDIDDLDTDDEDVTIVKHMVPASVVPRKKQRAVKREEAGLKIQSKDE